MPGLPPWCSTFPAAAGPPAAPPWRSTTIAASLVKTAVMMKKISRLVTKSSIGARSMPVSSVSGACRRDCITLPSRLRLVRRAERDVVDAAEVHLVDDFDEGPRRRLLLREDQDTLERVVDPVGLLERTRLRVALKLVGHIDEAAGIDHVVRSEQDTAVLEGSTVTLLVAQLVVGCTGDDRTLELRDRLIIDDATERGFIKSR